MLEDNSNKLGSREMELVDFRIMKKQTTAKAYTKAYKYVNVAKVREIIKMPVLTELPGVPDYVGGILSLEVARYQL